MNSTLTAQHLRDVLEYDQHTGIFTWLRGKRTGLVAGTAHSRGYVQIKVCGKFYLAHRLAWLWMYGSWPADEIDHVNGHHSDNSLKNLRAATHAQNLRNRGACRGSFSGLKGVSWFNPTSKWRARIERDGQTKTLGYFDTAEAAHAAYAVAAESLHGEFARVA